MLLVGCEKLFFDEDIDNSALANFEVFWNDFNRYYPFFEIKHMDWDSIHNHYKPLINEQTTDLQLFQIFSEMIAPLKDGHVTIKSNYGIAESYPMEVFDDYDCNKRRCKNGITNKISVFSFSLN